MPGAVPIDSASTLGVVAHVIALAAAILRHIAVITWHTRSRSALAPPVVRAAVAGFWASITTTITSDVTVIARYPWPRARFAPSVIGAPVTGLTTPILCIGR